MRTQLKTISGKTFSIAPNMAKRTFTIYTEFAKYRTVQLTKEEFNDSLHNTGKDWQNFLLGQDYYKVN